MKPATAVPDPLQHTLTPLPPSSAQRGVAASLSSAMARWIFNGIHGNCLVYNTCWEDPRLDREVLRLGPDDDVVMITSAGCNALDYALDAPRSIHAVDMNFRQNALLELKMAGIRRLPFEHFFALFGDGGHPDFPQWYRLHLRSGLSRPAQDYWDNRTHYFSRNDARDSFYHRGTTGHFGRILTSYFRVAGFYDAACELFAASSLDEQRTIYETSIKPRFFRGSIKHMLETDLALSLLGVPKAQREHLERTCGISMGEFMEDCVETIFTRLTTKDNYFWRLYLFGRYTRDCCPNYLRPEYFSLLKGGLVDRIQVHTNDLTSFLRRHDGSLSHFVLLDHMDWLSHEHPELLAAEWQAIADKARPAARLLWRSGGFRTDFIDTLPILHGGRIRPAGELLRYERELADDCHRRDRVHTYGSFHIADLVG